MNNKLVQVVTVTPNPAIDLTLTIPNFNTGIVNRVQQQQSKPGGKGVNVAAALADYGHKVAVTGFLGRENSDPFEALFSGKGIEDHFIRIAGETRIGIKVFDPALEQTTDINFPGQIPSPGDFELLLRELKMLAAESKPWFVLAGSLPPGVDATMYRDLVHTLKADGCRVLLDTSGEALRHALDAGPHIIKPNVHELEELVGKQLSTILEIVKFARLLLSNGIELAAVSMGAEGALFVNHEHAFLASLPNVGVRSTVGAGDAMVAGILTSQLGGMSVLESARLASAFALDALTRNTSALSSRDRINVLMDEITIQEMG